MTHLPKTLILSAGIVAGWIALAGMAMAPADAGQPAFSLQPTPQTVFSGKKTRGRPAAQGEGDKTRSSISRNISG